MNRLALSLVALLTATSASLADFAEFYVGVDSLQTIAGTGTYGGLANPNAGRLSLLYAHTYPDTPLSNHYHNKSAYTYTGPNLGTATAVNPRPASNWVPEGGTAANPLREVLIAGTGALAGQWVTDGEGWGDLEFRSTDSIAGFANGSPESILFNSSTQRYTAPVAGAELALQLLSFTPGVTIRAGDGSILLDAIGESTPIGTAGSAFSFTPTFAVDASAGEGNYAATFRLIDTRSTGGFAPSGEFTFNAVVPEPVTATMLIGASAVLIRRPRRG